MNPYIICNAVLFFWKLKENFSENSRKIFGKLKENFRKLKQNFRKLKQNPQKLNLPEIPVTCVAAKTAKK